VGKSFLADTEHTSNNAHAIDLFNELEKPNPTKNKAGSVCSLQPSQFATLYVFFGVG
jgi:hypothetical protein